MPGGLNGQEGRRRRGADVPSMGGLAVGSVAENKGFAGRVVPVEFGGVEAVEVSISNISLLMLNVPVTLGQGMQWCLC